MNEITVYIRMDPLWSDKLLQWSKNEYNDYFDHESFAHILDSFSCYLHWYLHTKHSPPHPLRIKTDIIQGFHLYELNEISLEYLFRLFEDISACIKSITPSGYSVRCVDVDVDGFMLRGVLITMNH